MANFYSLRSLSLVCAILTSMAQACPPSPLPDGVKPLTMPEVVQNAYTKSDTVFVATVTNVVPTHENKPNQVKAILKPVQIYKGDPSGLLEFDFELNSMGCGHIKPQRAGNSVMYFIQRFPSGGFHLLTLNLTDSSGVKINIQENAKIIEQVRRLSATKP